MKFNHRKLLGRIKEKYGSQNALARSINWSDAQLSARLNNRVQFGADEILLLASPDVLDICTHDIPDYFFTV